MSGWGGRRFDVDEREIFGPRVSTVVQLLLYLALTRVDGDPF
jgi:hypothetical protein